MPSLAHYEKLALLFEYPGPEFPAQVRSACEALESRYPVAAVQLDSFARMLPSEGGAFTEKALGEMQELFTRSFDVQSVTTLDVGYVMFGDDYKRGELLSNLSREHRAAGVDCGSELPDHLPNVLRLVARWRDRELVREFVEEILYPALERMIGEFGRERMAQRSQLYRKHFKTLIDSSLNRGTIFRKPLVAVAEVLKEDFGLNDRKPTEHEADFLGSIGRELDLETGGRPSAQSRSSS